MSKIEFPFPHKGKNENFALEDQPPETSADILNIRPYDSIEDRQRGGKRPALVKWGRGDLIGWFERIDKMVVSSEQVFGPDFPDDFNDEVGTVWKINGALNKILWTVNFGSGSVCRRIAIDSNGDVFVSGDQITYNAQTASIWKLNGANGFVIWGYDTGSDLRNLIVDANDDVVVGGNYNGTDQDGDSGNAIWKLNGSTGAKITDYAMTGETYGVILDPSNTDIYTGGFFSFSGDGAHNVKRFDSDLSFKDGAALGPNVDYFQGIGIDSSSNIYCSASDASNEYGLYKADADLALQWRYETDSRMNDATVDSSGGIYFAGQRGSDEDSGIGSVRKINAAGTKIWELDVGEGAHMRNLLILGDYLYAVGDEVNSVGLWKINKTTGIVDTDFTVYTRLRGIYHDGTDFVICGDWNG